MVKQHKIARLNLTYYKMVNGLVDPEDPFMSYVAKWYCSSEVSETTNLQ